MKFSVKKPRILVSCALVALCAAGAANSMAQQNKNRLPEIGTSATSTLSLDKERIYGDAMMRQVRASMPLIQDPVLIEYINHLGNSLVRNAEDVNYQFDFFLVNNKEINAFAFFGGHIGVHSGLLTMADNESELASVLAHEIAHVTQRHLARKLEAQSKTMPWTLAGMVTGVLLALVNPEAGMAALSAANAAGAQAGINYTRSNEKEADRVGMSILVNSGFDPNGAPDFFKKMSAKYRYTSKPPAMLLTHPLPDSRITDSRNRAQAYPSRLLPASLEFELAKARLRARYQGDAKDNITNFKAELKREQFQYREAGEYGLALSYFANEEYSEAEVLLTGLLGKYPNNLFFVDAMTDTYLEQKKYSQALTMLERLNLLMPNNQVVTLNYANSAIYAGEYELATNLLQDFLILNPDHFIAYDLLTEVYRKQEKPSQMHASQAEVYALLGLYPKAIDELHTAYNFASEQTLMKKRIKARIVQFQERENQLKRL
ncbi:beta-barrel assembly-enhancing protease [Thalassotalea mangrovi]|uniref:Putative beta-barrel assembly-enhancing protease n=1 Tax=Thalassotalea mangrovi TaxID=2572245 RepID=A0A4U1B4H2_9GAMM|nr:M48 family metalloprotease [Thalassotalea mangrovi]TKB44365.1 M48 family metallopeptidase [Thalassotalea mangrovi]